MKIKMENSPIPLFPSPPIQIFDEEFHAFHLKDRKLYQILVDDLERDPLQSMKVMAFWMWLEREVCVRVNLIHTLVDFPCNLINEVADESVICLMSCQFEYLPVSEAYHELAVLPNLAHPNVAAKKLSLQDFHYNRVSIILNVNKIVKDVCLRAFKHYAPKKPRAGLIFPGPTHISRDNNKGKGVHTSASTKIEGFPKPNYDFSGSQPPAEKLFCGQISAPIGVASTQRVFPSFFVAYAKMPPSYNPGTNVVINKEEDNIFPDDRTIFITFSKGYPVSALEVRDFLTRRFGDCVETIYMQDVPPHLQALYARVVVRSAATVDMIVQGGRAKYSIFGKHVWARKYVKKN